jgi:nucleotide-binding universal stress UspA family protein
VLICVSSGEPGKEDVLFTGRLMRHLGAKATLLTVLPTTASQELRNRAQRFLDAGARTLGLLGVGAKTVIRHGGARDEILAEMNDGGYDMLVIGAPLPNGDGRDVLTGIAGEILGNVTQHPVLIIRSVYAQTDIPRLVLTERARNEEVVR